jgi:FKBP-type peptidyl-prolyl cis-trans isomerase
MDIKIKKENMYKKGTFNMRKIIIFLCFSLSVTGCEHTGDDAEQITYIDKNKMVNINRYMANKDLNIMRHFIKRKSWRMTFSDDGYFFEISDEGNPDKITDNKHVTYDCSITLLDGTHCYDRKNKTFVVGGTEEISGLHHAMKRLGNGGKARFIFPSYLAYGLPGDFNKIPPRAILLYNVHVTDVK